MCKVLRFLVMVLLAFQIGLCGITTAFAETEIKIGKPPLDGGKIAFEIAAGVVGGCLVGAAGALIGMGGVGQED